jgi:hypothetical protein
VERQYEWSFVLSWWQPLETKFCYGSRVQLLFRWDERPETCARNSSQKHSVRKWRSLGKYSFFRVGESRLHLLQTLCLQWRKYYVVNIYFAQNRNLWLPRAKKIRNVRFQVLPAASMKFRIVFWDVLPCKIIVYRRLRGTYCLHHQGWWSLMMEAVRTSETSVDNYFTRQYIPEDNFLR